MARQDILNKNTLLRNIKDTNSNFKELYQQVGESIKDFKIDDSSIVSDSKVVNLSTITTSDIDKLF